MSNLLPASLEATAPCQLFVIIISNHQHAKVSLFAILDWSTSSQNVFTVILIFMRPLASLHLFTSVAFNPSTKSCFNLTSFYFDQYSANRSNNVSPFVPTQSHCKIVSLLFHAFLEIKNLWTDKEFWGKNARRVFSHVRRSSRKELCYASATIEKMSAATIFDATGKCLFRCSFGARLVFVPKHQLLLLLRRE